MKMIIFFITKGFPNTGTCILKHGPYSSFGIDGYHSGQLKPGLTQNVPVFGTEEALVEPMLLALEPTIPFPALSAKKSKGENKERGLLTIE